MAIQFHCSNCGQPIEVDDEHAGKTAACPYCRQVAAVPRESTYQPGQTATARPAATEGQTPLPESPRLDAAPSADPTAPLTYAAPPSAALTDRQRAAAAFGKYALICAGIVIALFVFVAVSGAMSFSRIAAANKGRVLTWDEIMEQSQKSPVSPWAGAATWGLLFVALLGATLAVVSLTQSRANWRGWTALVLCGGSLLCICGLVVISALMFAGGMRPA